MPSKNTVKDYVEDGYYHVYNRGVNKYSIFQCEMDYRMFLSYIKEYLLPKDIEKLKQPNQGYLALNNFEKKIELLAYCLMPNHFHFLLHQKGIFDMKLFLQSLMTRYIRYFNMKYKRIGPLFQGRYKAVLITSDEQLLYLTRYIHLNPLALVFGENWQSLTSDDIDNAIRTQPSSYPNYLKEIEQEWVKPEFILGNFSSSGFNTYKNFVVGQDSDLEVMAITRIKDTGIDLDLN